MDTEKPGFTQQGTGFGKLFTTAAITWFSTTILLVGVTIFSFMLFAVRNTVYGPGFDRANQAEFNARALHTLSLAEARDVFSHFRKMGDRELFEYQPWVGFSERVYHSPNVNVDSAEWMPTRRTSLPSELGRASGEIVIWMFGGSTMFGWGVPDGQTIPSHVAAILGRHFRDRRIKVINHGHCYFYSSQEALLFLTLLRRSEKCDVAVFLDGFNDSGAGRKDIPSFADRMAAAFRKEQQGSPSSRAYVSVSPEFPPVRLLAGIINRLHLRKQEQHRELDGSTDCCDPAEVYRFNMSFVENAATSRNIKTQFVWQPTAFDYIESKFKDLGMAALNARIHNEVKAPNFRFLAGLFEGQNFEDVYVDPVHYGDVGGRRIAEEICKTLIDRKVLPPMRD